MPKLAFFFIIFFGCPSNFPGEIYFLNPCMYSFTSFFSAVVLYLVSFRKIECILLFLSFVCLGIRDLGIRDLGIHDVGYSRSWVFRTVTHRRLVLRLRTS